jgi:predicted SnoaL-like aldol condensation-catalyzing enzyme
MKKYCLAFAITVMIFCLSCNNQPPGTPSVMTQKNLDAMKGVRQAIDNKDYSKLGDFIASDAVDHSGEHGDIKGIDSIKLEFQTWTAMADEKTEVIKELADGDYVMSWVHDIGKYKVDGEGHKAGETFDLQTMEVAKFSDGKVTEHWSMMQPVDVMKMMASTTALPTTPKPTLPVDSAKMKK